MDKKFKKALLVYNAKSGNANSILSNFDLITKYFLKNNITLTLYSVSNKYNKLVDILKIENYDILILSGGDGTLSRILSELYVNNVKFPNVAIFPTGTSNDFAHSLNLGTDIEDWIKNITEGKAKYVDFGLINNEKVFLSSYAGGLFTKISYETDKKLKKMLGKNAYYIQGLSELTNIKEFDLEITLESGKKIYERAILYIIINGENVGGFSKITKEVDMNDGHMNIIIVKNVENPFDIPQLLIDLFSGNFMNNEYTREIITKSCIIEKVKENIGVSIDGEKGINEKVNVRFINDKLKIYCKNE